MPGNYEQLVLSNPQYVDTRPNRFGLLSAPEGTADYTAWLLARIEAGAGERVVIGDTTYTQTRGGTHQFVSALAEHARRGGQVFIYGPHAGAAASVIEQLAGDGATVEVLA